MKDPLLSSAYCKLGEGKSGLCMSQGNFAFFVSFMLRKLKIGVPRVYFARDFIFSMVPTKYFAHIPANFFEFNVFVFEL